MSMRYEYRVLRAHTVLEIAAPQWREDSYIARDEPAVAYKQALADGFRWVRTEGEWAIFERAIDYGPETAEFEVQGRPAAPEMLEALRDVANCLENWMEIAEEHDQRGYDIEAMRKARAAIAKATGVTNG